jgi:hypothetical protein
MPAGVAARAHQVEDAQIFEAEGAAARSGLFIPAVYRIEQKMNTSTAENHGVGPAARGAFENAAAFELRRYAEDGKDDLGEVGCRVEERFGQ